MAYPEQYVSPEHIQIETIRGVCSSRCIMCPIHTRQRKPARMSQQRFELLLQRLAGNRRQKFLTLHGLGEPLLDREIAAKVSIAKKHRYNGIGFAINCTELTEQMSKDLLEADLDTLICSLDGVSKETHESIRIGTDFDAIIDNVLRFISIRNNGQYTTKVLIHFINQESNKHEWDDYRAYWNKHLNPARGDGVLRFDVHNWGKDESIGSLSHQPEIIHNSPAHTIVCADLENRLIVQASGRISFCCADEGDSFALGNAFEEDPYTLYNSGIFTLYREAMRQGTLNTLPPCATCSIVTNRQTRILSASREKRHE